MDSKYYNNMTDTIYNLDRSIDRHYEQIADSYRHFQIDTHNGNTYRNMMVQLIKRKTRLIKNIVDMHNKDIKMSLNMQHEVLQLKINSFNKYRRKDETCYE